MAIKITIKGAGSEEEITSQEEAEPQITMELQARKSLNGDIMVFDHPDVDIIIMPENKKVLALCKNLMDDSVYETQNQLFRFLHKRGVIVYDSVKGGNVYGSLEATIQESKMEGVDSVQSALFNVGRFIESERPYYEYEKARIEQEEEALLEPDASSSTELGEVPQEVEKGSLRPGWIRGPYGLYDLYRA